MTQDRQPLGSKKQRFSVPRKLLAGAVASSLFIVPTTSAFAAPADQSAAKGQVLDLGLLAADLLTAAGSTSGNLSSAGPNSDPIKVGLLGDLANIDIGTLNLPLIKDADSPNGLLELGEVGLLNSYADSIVPGSVDPETRKGIPDATSARAAAGVITEDGAIAVDTSGNGGSADMARVNLTDLLAQLNVDKLTAGVVDELALEIGALASRAEKSGGIISDKSGYTIAGTQIVLHSKTVETMSDDLTDIVNGAGGGLETALGATGPLQTLLNETPQIKIPLLLDISLGQSVAKVSGLDTLLAGIASGLLQSELTDSSGIVSINLERWHRKDQSCESCERSPAAGFSTGFLQIPR